MIEIPRVWTYEADVDSLHFIVQEGPDQRRIWLKRSQNAALYDFLFARIGDEPAGPPDSN